MKRFWRSKAGKQARKRYQQSEKGRACTRHHTNLRRARKRDALVPGAEAAIKAIEARRDWYIEHGWPAVIDHIFDLGFGWHEPANMQIIHCEDNSRKSVGDPYYEPVIVFDRGRDFC